MPSAKRRFYKHRIRAMVALLVLCTCFMFALTACNDDTQASDAPIERALYLNAVGYDEENLTVVVTVTFAGAEDKKLDCKQSVWTSERGSDGVWYNKSLTSVQISPSSIFSAADARVPQEERIKNDVEYNSLKVYLRYDTMYKSIKSDAEQVVRNGRYYLHFYEMSAQDEGKTLTLEMRTQNSAAWYSILAVCAVVLLAVCITVFALIKGRAEKRADEERSE